MRDIHQRLEAKGVRLVRIPTVDLKPVAVDRWLPSLKGIPPPDLIVVTSRAAVPMGLVPWQRSRSVDINRIRFWAAGPGTAEALRRIGVRRVHCPRRLGNVGIIAALRRTPARTILHFRSDRAGPILSRGLERVGHRVTEAVVYRVRPRDRLSLVARRELFRATVVVASSPSSLAGLERSLGRLEFRRLRGSARLVVFGPTSKSAARALGFRHVSVTPSMTTQRFTGYLLGKLRDART